MTFPHSFHGQCNKKRRSATIKFRKERSSRKKIFLDGLFEEDFIQVGSAPLYTVGVSEGSSYSSSVYSIETAPEDFSITSSEASETEADEDDYVDPSWVEDPLLEVRTKKKKNKVPGQTSDPRRSSTNDTETLRKKFERFEELSKQTGCAKKQRVKILKEKYRRYNNTLSTLLSRSLNSPKREKKPAQREKSNASKDLSRGWSFTSKKRQDKTSKPTRKNSDRNRKSRKSRKKFQFHTCTIPKHKQRSQVADVIVSSLERREKKIGIAKPQDAIVNKQPRMRARSKSDPRVLIEKPTDSIQQKRKVRKRTGNKDLKDLHTVQVVRPNAKKPKQQKRRQNE
eukprot:TRINITY_DN2962_c0_g1_i2.p1 TRINITY_DN2962_c0_g1~~TRINITY_DN2962_c0_g1_i2.p1  ORF type:complete len:340 (-),score=47.93 TRINITY_DN2962_c0_g1_i2:50-1069(-)